MQNSRITCQREDFDADSLFSVTTYINKSYCNFHGLYTCVYMLKAVPIWQIAVHKINKRFV